MGLCELARRGAAVQTSWHFSRVFCDLVNAGGCGGRREPRVIINLKGSTMNVKTNVKVGSGLYPVQRLH
jgi:hypothetical protein